LVSSTNKILSGLASADSRLLEPHLASIKLRVPKQLEARNKAIEQIYFIESGFASVVASGSGRAMEVGIIGREGMTGLAFVLGKDRSPHETFIQLAGVGQRIAAPLLRRAIGQSASLQLSFLRYAHDFYLQIAQTAVTNGRSTVEERLARWLLMAHDRVDGDELLLTHEFMAMMIAVRRASVTDTLHLMEEAGLIATRRNAITILNRVGLEKSSNGFYVAGD
jgi:CRP-like cAMP-binding protein